MTGPFWTCLIAAIIVSVAMGRKRRIAVSFEPTARGRRDLAVVYAEAVSIRKAGVRRQSKRPAVDASDRPTRRDREVS